MAANINNFQDLQDNLRAAMSIELTTMPPYLYAYWSIRPVADGGSREGAEVARIILSVVLEEMLHMGLVSNILNSLGGSPAITESPYLPSFPGSLLRHKKGLFGFEVFLRPLSLRAVNTFLKIEKPAGYKKPILFGSEEANEIIDNWGTIGEFYQALEQQLKRDTKDKDYTGKKQLPNFTNPGAGQMVQVNCLHDALVALELIVEQGEGRVDEQKEKEKEEDGDHELSHFYKFKEIQDNILRGNFDLNRDVYPVVHDPFAASYNEEQTAANNAFNVTYSRLLDFLQTSFSSDTPDVFYAGTGLMNDLTHKAAVLRNTGKISGTEYVPGPTFEYIPLNQR